MPDPSVTLTFVGDGNAAVKTTDALAAALVRLGEAGARAATQVSKVNVSLGQTAVVSRRVATLGNEYARVEQALSGVSAQIANAVSGFVDLSNSAQQAAQQVANVRAAQNRSAGAGSGGGGGGGILSGMLGGGVVRSALATTAALTGVSLSMATVGAGAQQLISANASLDQAMSAVAAVGGLDKQGAQYRELVGLVRDYGATTQYSSVEAAQGLRELVAAGYSATDATKLLGNILNLAATDNMSMGRASEILVATLQSMRLGVDQSTRVVDVLARGANASTASIDDFGESLKYAAPLASSMGIPLEDVSAALALLANNGLKGGLAGRGLSAVMARMVAPTKDAAEAITGAGRSLAEINPQVVGLGNAIKALEGIPNDALVKVFGAENLDISNTLAANAKTFAGLQAQMIDPSGVTAKQMAKTASDHLLTEYKKLGNVAKDVAVDMGAELYVSLGDGIKNLTSFLAENREEFVHWSGVLGEVMVNLGKVGQWFSTIGQSGKVGKAFWKTVGGVLEVGGALLDYGVGRVIEGQSHEEYMAEWKANKKKELDAKKEADRLSAGLDAPATKSPERRADAYDTAAAGFAKLAEETRAAGASAQAASDAYDNAARAIESVRGKMASLLGSAGYSEKTIAATLTGGPEEIRAAIDQLDRLGSGYLELKTSLLSALTEMTVIQDRAKAARDSLHDLQRAYTDLRDQRLAAEARAAGDLSGADAIEKQAKLRSLTDQYAKAGLGPEGAKAAAQAQMDAEDKVAAGKIAASKAEFEAQVRIAELKAKGDSEAVKTAEKELAIAQLTARLKEELRYDDETAAELAQRKVEADRAAETKAASDVRVVASSIQAVGGGGGFYGVGSVQDEQLRVQRDIAESSRRTADAMTAGGMTGAGGQPGKDNGSVLVSAINQVRGVLVEIKEKMTGGASLSVRTNG